MLCFISTITLLETRDDIICSQSVLAYIWSCLDSGEVKCGRNLLLASSVERLCSKLFFSGAKFAY